MKTYNLKIRGIVLSLTVMLLPLLVNANPIDINGIWYYFSSEGNNVFVSSAPDETKYIGSVDIPSTITYGDAVYNVTGIRGSAFAHCDKLTSVIIPEGVTKIAQSAFYDCINLNSVYIPESLVEIKEYAFLNCTNLERIVLQKNIKRIFEGAFAGCNQLIEIYCYSQEVPSINARAFDESCLKNATLYIPLDAIEAYRTTKPWNNFGNIVPIEEVEVKKCATPTISYTDGKIIFACNTEKAIIKSNVAENIAGDYNDMEIAFTSTYTITAYATKENYEDSDPTTLTLCWFPCTEEHEEGDETTNILTIPSKPVFIQCSDGVITLSGLTEGTEVAAYNTAGQELATAIATEGAATLTTGLEVGSTAVVKIGNNSIKIVIR